MTLSNQGKFGSPTYQCTCYWVIMLLASFLICQLGCRRAASSAAKAGKRVRHSAASDDFGRAIERERIKYQAREFFSSEDDDNSQGYNQPTYYGQQRYYPSQPQYAPSPNYGRGSW